MLGYVPKITLPADKSEIRKGDGIVFVANGKAMAVDMFMGGEPTQNIVGWLKSQGIRQIDLAVATHAHGDHYGGFYELVSAGISIKEFRCYHINSIASGNEASREDSRNLLKLIRWLQQRGTRVLFVDHGDVLQFEDISWHIYRKQPKSAKSSDTNGWEYVNNGSLVLYSPELMGMLCGDGPEDAKDAIAYFQKKFGKDKILAWFDIAHHGNNFNGGKAQAAKKAGAVVAYESNIEKNGPGTTTFTLYGARRVRETGIEVWMQNEEITITADNGTLTLKHGVDTVTAAIPYHVPKEQVEADAVKKKFIDVSEFNEIDWDKAKAELKGVMVRCGLRGSLKSNSQYYMKIRKDFKFDKHSEALHRLGIPYSVYYFPTDCTDAEAMESAKWLYELVKDLDISFPIALDVENVNGSDGEQGRANGLSKSDRTRFIKIILDYLENKGYNIGIYASASWLNTKIDMAQFSENARKCTWVADWDAPVDYKGQYWLWQYGKTTISGCSKQVDVDSVMYDMPATIDKNKEAAKVETNPVSLLISIAKAEVGTHEGPNNQTKYGDELHSIQPKNMDKNAAWCDAFVDWCILQTCYALGYDEAMARKVLCGDFDDYTYFSIDHYKKENRWTTKPGVGYQIFFGGAGHTGIVYQVENNKVYTIEGNKADEVRYCVYDASNSSILGYGMPRYELISSATVNETPDSYNVPKEDNTGKKVEFIQLCLGGLVADGLFGQVNMEAWMSICNTLPEVSKGNKSEYVKAIQMSLGGLTVDGSFGDKTYNAVAEFQKAHNLEATGVVNTETWIAIFTNVMS